LEGDSKMITCSWKNLPLKVKAGAKIYIADGSVTCEVVETKPPVYTFLILLFINRIKLLLK